MGNPGLVTSNPPDGFQQNIDKKDQIHDKIIQLDVSHCSSHSSPNIESSTLW